MFRNPTLQANQSFPPAPLGDPQFPELIAAVGVTLDSDRDPLEQLMLHTRTKWLDRDQAALDPTLALPYDGTSAFPLLREVGLIEGIAPPRERYDYAVMDGGAYDVLQHRLGHITGIAEAGVVDTIHVFGGQTKRKGNEDTDSKLFGLATQVYGQVGEWGRAWLGRELAKDPLAENVWERPFATEHELAILALMQLYPGQLEHVRTIGWRTRPEALPGFPEVEQFAEEFRTQSGITIQVSNVPAAQRLYGDNPLPNKRARPTGRSCFMKWLEETRPPKGASVLFASSQPYVYRSWMDVLQGRELVGRPDIVIDGTGAPIAPGERLETVVRALGTIFINFYNEATGHIHLKSLRKPDLDSR